MQVTAKLRYLRIAPRKVRLVADLIRGKKAEEAKNLLTFTVKKSNLPFLKLLNQALANAKNNFQLDPTNLFISKLTVDEGPKLKRWRARARGQGYEIQKKTSHINLILDELVKSKKTKKSKGSDEVKSEVILSSQEAVGAGELKESKKEKPKFEEKFDVKKPKAENRDKRFFKRTTF